MLPRFLAAFALSGLAGLLLVGCPSSGPVVTGATGAGGSSGHTSSASGSPTSSSSGGTGGDGGGGPSPIVLPDGGPASPCSLPGTVQFTSNGATTVPGGLPGWPSLAFLHLPAGFCAHYYGTVPNARQIRLAPGGELFVASPTALSTGGGPGGLNAFLVLPDDDADGVADENLTFLSFGAGAMNQGMLFATGYFYYQDGTPPGTSIMRMPYKTGDRSPSGASAQVAALTVYTSGLHWAKTMDIADDGSIYVGNGGDQGETCVTPHPFHGGVLKIDPEPVGPSPDGSQIAKGLRNPIAIRCQRGHDNCFALELAKDYTYGQGGREKLIPIRLGDDWGFPCCATRNLPYVDAPANTDCSGVAADTDSFYIGDTPFGLDFEPGTWPSPWQNRAFVATHGAVGTWQGARIVAFETDPTTGMPLPGTNMSSETANTGAMTDFATGWYDDAKGHSTGSGRPAAIAFSGDGRLFVANDSNGVIFWVAPLP